MMGDMTKNFSRAEFACKCGCGLDNIDPRLVELLQAIRDFFNRPVRVVSGLRCPARNAKVGGAKRSKHLTGEAADIQVADVAPRAVADYAATHMRGWGGIKAYPSFTHIDIRQTLWRG